MACATITVMPTVFDGKKQESHDLLHSFCVYPGIHFESQEEDETVILALRAHPITQLPWVFSALILFLIPVIANFLVPRLVDLSIAELLFLNLFWYSFLISYVFLNVLNWLFNVGIVTNKRVLDFDFKVILYKEVSASSLVDVTDASITSVGFIASFFNYGDVFVQTAGPIQNIEFLRVPQPTDVVSIINKLATEV